MTCEHPRPSFHGMLGDLILAMCPCGHHWTVADRWFAHGNFTALQKHEPGAARSVVMRVK